MTWRIFTVLLLLILCKPNVSFSQLESLDFNLSVSNSLDGDQDMEYDYEQVLRGVLAVWTVGYSHQIKPKMLITPLVGFSHAINVYTNLKRSNSILLEDRTFVNKSQVSLYATAGCGFSYWPFKMGQGLSIRSELYFHFLFHSKQTIEKRLDFMETTFSSLDTRPLLKSIVPTFKIGPELNLRLGKRIAVNLGLFVDFKATGFYRESTNNSYVNKGFEFGFRYILKG